MKILGLDTSGDSCSAALYDAAAGNVIAQERVAIERGHAEILFAQIARVMDSANLPLKSVDRFAVTIGPGTFTGVRIGLAAARGFALAAKKPLIGINSLEVVAAGAEAPAQSILVAAFDARRGELYFQAFRDSRAITQPIAASIGDAANMLAGANQGAQFLAIGTGAEILRAAMRAQRANCEIARGEPLPRADILARIAAARAISAEPVMPLYLRAPDAKLPARP